jgi:hypothetical protein
MEVAGTAGESNSAFSKIQLSEQLPSSGIQVATPRRHDQGHDKMETVSCNYDTYIYNTKVTSCTGEAEVRVTNVFIVFRDLLFIDYLRGSVRM